MSKVLCEWLKDCRNWDGLSSGAEAENESELKTQQALNDANGMSDWLHIALCECQKKACTYVIVGLVNTRSSQNEVGIGFDGMCQKARSL